MTKSEFVGWVENNVARVHEYKLGCDGSNGKCDCIGLIIGAWRLSGNSWPWTHGSNYTARYLTDNLGENLPLNLGDLVFKGRKQGDSGYKLPDRYRNSGDLTDYYHVGVVTSVDPLVITHCTSVEGGIKTDTKRGNWKYSGQFSKLEGGVTVDMMCVTAPNGQPVNMRQLPNVNSAIVAKVPVGTQVAILGTTDTGWTHIQYGAKKGWMMSKFLTNAENAPVVEPDADSTFDKAAIRAALNAIITQAEIALDMVDRMREEG